MRRAFFVVNLDLDEFLLPLRWTVSSRLFWQIKLQLIVDLFSLVGLIPRGVKQGLVRGCVTGRETGCIRVTSGRTSVVDSQLQVALKFLMLRCEELVKMREIVKALLIRSLR